MDVRRVRLLAGLLGFLAVFAIGNDVLGFERWTIHWWANSFWTLASLCAGLKCLDTARRLTRRSQRQAWTCFGLGCLSWCLGMLLWAYAELVRHQLTPFPGLADLGYLGLPPLFIAGFYFYGAQAPARRIDVKQLCNLGILLCSTMIIMLMVLVDPLTTQGRTLLYVLGAIGYPILYFTALLYGLACLWLYTTERDRSVLLVLMVGLLILTVTNLFYAQALLLERYEVGASLDIYWLAGFSFLGWAAWEQGWLVGPTQPAQAGRSVPAPSWELEAALPALAMLSIVGVGFLNRDNLQSSLWEPVTPAAIGLVSFIGLREWWHSRVQGRLLETVCESEVEIRKLSQFLESVIDNANIWMAVIDQQLNIVLWNKAAESLSGYARGEVLGSSRIWEWLYPEQEKRQRALLRIKQLIEQGSVLEQYETSVRCSDNQLRTIAWNTRSLLGADGRPAGLITLGVDITASQQAERDLRQREERLRVVVENLPMVLFAVDAAGVIRLLEGKGLAALGLRPGELVGRSILDLGEQYPELQEGARRGLAGTGSKLTLEMRGRVFDQWIDPLTDEQGQSAGFVGVALDISERRRLEAQLLQSQKIESIGRLAGGVAHDFNNLLTAIVGYTDLALATLPPGSPARSDLEESQKATQRAISLTRQLLAFARKQLIAPRVLNLNELILDMDSLLRRLIGEDVTLVMLPAPNLGPIRVDPHQMEQVLVNLVVNARDAMPHGGQLVVETCNLWVDERTPRANGELAAGAYVLLTISDTGIGMPAEVRAHVFEPFFTTKTASQGSGLGLATCYGIVKQHGGHIAIDSQTDYGTTVSVYLPRVEAPPDLPPRAVEQHNLPSGHETVLLVEDELGVRMLAGRVLREAGYTVLEAAHGAEALQVVQGHAPQPLQLLVVDMVMPHMGGQAVAERIAAIYPAVKVLFMSGYTDSAIVHPGMGLPDQGFLQKPFTPATLARKVRTILDGRG